MLGLLIRLQKKNERNGANSRKEEIRTERENAQANKTTAKISYRCAPEEGSLTCLMSRFRLSPKAT